MVLGWTSCGNNDDYLAFVGTWGVDRIDYYNIDYAGQPIAATIETYYFTPGDPDNGIDLVFRNDRSGEMRDRSRDTLYVPLYDDDYVIVDTEVIICPDTTLVTKFTYSYHEDDNLLYMNMEVERPFTYKMKIEEFSDNSFVYINEYNKDYVEKAKLIRISDDTRATRSRKADKPASRPFRSGTIFSNY